MRRSDSLGQNVWCVGTLAVALLATACSKASEPAVNDVSPRDGGSSNPDGSVNVPTPPVTNNGDPDSSTPVTANDGGIQGPAFDMTAIASLQGTFVTDKTGLQGVQSNATVTWSFKIDNIGDATQPVTTAKWSAQATNVTGGNVSDFPPDTNVSLSLQRTSAGADPASGVWELYGNEQSPYVYILVKVEGGHIVDLHYYKRLLDDSETNPADKPRNVIYTATNK